MFAKTGSINSGTGWRNRSLVTYSWACIQNNQVKNPRSRLPTESTFLRVYSRSRFFPWIQCGIHEKGTGSNDRRENYGYRRSASHGSSSRREKLKKQKHLGPSDRRPGISVVRIRMLGLQDPVPSLEARGTDPDPSIIKQKSKTNLDYYLYSVTWLLFDFYIWLLYLNTDVNVHSKSK